MLIVAWLTVVLLAAPVPAQKPGRDRVLKVDAVELIDHQRQMEGAPNFQARHGRYLYLFANAANADVFRANPTKYEIQLGGACARMGPLSGEGSPKIFAVHQGRLYIFASKQCRRAFLQDPSTVLEADDPPPVTTPQSLVHGRELIARAVAALGGASRLDAVASYQEKLSRATPSGAKTYMVTDTTTLLLPHSVGTVNCWNEQCWGYFVTPAASWVRSGDDEEPLVAAQQQAVLRSAGRHPLMLLRNREAPDMVIASSGEKRRVPVAEAGVVEVELVVLHRGGATTTLGIDDQGRVRWMSYHGRGPKLTLGTMEATYSAFHEVAGLMVPGRIDSTFDGQPFADRSGTFAVQTVDEPAHARLFEH